MWTKEDKIKYEVLERLSNAFYEKQYYFDEPDGKVFSRVSHEMLHVDEAIDEFASTLRWWAPDI